MKKHITLLPRSLGLLTILLFASCSQDPITEKKSTSFR